ncbi:hypothetical protein J3R82DRAFT_5851 [Butyriboletus roseoflavus]|nr:hypothetical protein J3R82DRAFT_5851 [Butyriboletus roseoflavus]
MRQYQWSENGSTNPGATALYALAKGHLPVALEAKFAEFPVAIIEKHGKDLTIGGEPSRTGTPAPTSAPVAATGPAAPSARAPAIPIVAALNTSKIVKEATFMAAADDLFGLLTDPKRIPSWTRARAESVAKADSPYSLFDGGVKGRYLSLTPGKEIVQTWALTSPIWPSEHEATLTTTLEESSDSTKVTFTLAGVPKGLEDELGRNIDGYYVHGLKSIGYVQLIVSPTHTQPGRAPQKSRPPKNRGDVADNKTATAIAIAVVVLAAAFSVPYLSYSSISHRSFAK